MKITKERIDMPGFALFKGAASQENSAKLTDGFRSAAIDAEFFQDGGKWAAQIESTGSVGEALYLKYGSITAGLLPVKRPGINQDHIGVSLYAKEPVFFGKMTISFKIEWGMDGKSYRTAFWQIFKSMVLADNAASAIKAFNTDYTEFIVNKIFV